MTTGCRSVYSCFHLAHKPHLICCNFVIFVTLIVKNTHVTLFFFFCVCVGTQWRMTWTSRRFWKLRLERWVRVSTDVSIVSRTLLLLTWPSTLGVPLQLRVSTETSLFGLCFPVWSRKGDSLISLSHPNHLLICCKRSQWSFELWLCVVF